MVTEPRVDSTHVAAVATGGSGEALTLFTVPYSNIYTYIYIINILYVYVDLRVIDMNYI